MKEMREKPAQIHFPLGSLQSPHPHPPSSIINPSLDPQGTCESYVTFMDMSDARLGLSKDF